MSVSLAFIIDGGDVWWVVLAVAAWLVLMCLKAIGKDIDHAVRWHDLKVEAHGLRLRQQRRLKELGIKGKRQ